MAALDLFTALAKTRDASRHQTVVDNWAWTLPDVLLSPAAPDFDEAFEQSFDTNQRLMLDTSACCPWRVVHHTPHAAVQAVPGRGCGLVATAPLPRGTLLVHEHGAVGTKERLASWLLVTGEELAGTPRAQESWSPYRNVSLADWCLALSRLGENKFTPAALDEPGGGGSSSEEEADADDDNFVLFRTLSRVNHACAPNAVRHMGGLGGGDPSVVHLFAQQDIAAGEEITMRYSAEEGAQQRSCARLLAHERD